MKKLEIIRDFRDSINNKELVEKGTIYSCDDERAAKLLKLKYAKLIDEATEELNKEMEQEIVADSEQEAQEQDKELEKEMEQEVVADSEQEVQEQNEELEKEIETEYIQKKEYPKNKKK